MCVLGYVFLPTILVGSIELVGTAWITDSPHWLRKQVFKASTSSLAPLNPKLTLYEYMRYTTSGNEMREIEPFLIARFNKINNIREKAGIIKVLAASRNIDISSAQEELLWDYLVQPYPEGLSPTQIWNIKDAKHYCFMRFILFYYNDAKKAKIMIDAHNKFIYDKNDTLCDIKYSYTEEKNRSNSFIKIMGDNNQSAIYHGDEVKPSTTPQEYPWE